MNPLVEHLYARLPVWAQNAAISTYGFSYRHERLGGEFARHVAEFATRGAWAPDRMNAYVEKQLRSLLLSAFQYVPYYRRKWSQAGITAGDLARITCEDLPRLPLTPKSDLRSDPEAFVSSLTCQREKLLRYHSSGSTGTPITCICTADGHRRFMAAREARSFQWADASIHMSRAMLGGRMVVPHAGSGPPYFRYNIAERQVYFSAYHISPSTVSDYVQGFNKYKPALLTGYANSYFFLARMMMECGLRLDYEPRALVLSSEKLTSDMKDVIRRAFRARAFEEYGSVENCVLATECPRGRLHVNPDFGIIEIVDQSGAPVPPGVDGRMLCTGLQNEAQPLIRYDIGDIARWSRQPCPCGRSQLPVLEEIEGRLEDQVVGPDGRQMVRFHGLFVDLPSVIEGQVIQEELARLRVRVVATDRFSQQERLLIMERARNRLGPVRVEIERVPALERTSRGKLRAVISHVSRADC